MRVTKSEYETILRRQQSPAPPRAMAYKLPALSEQKEQEIVIEWASYMKAYMPELEYLFHVPNGGTRDIVTANMLKLAGVQAGVPDLLLLEPMPRADGGLWHGLAIEMKRADHSNHPSSDQKRWLDHLRSVGFLCVVCYGADEAIRTLTTYLGGEVDE